MATIDPKGLLDRLLGSSGRLATRLRRRLRDTGHLEGLALINTLAATAFQDWQAARQGPAGPSFRPLDAGDPHALGRKLIATMIAAAQTDGAIDAAEQAQIAIELDELDVGIRDKAMIVDMLRSPDSAEAIARSADSLEEAAALYTASLLALDVDTAAERNYLKRLAAALRLDPALARHLHTTTEGAVKPGPHTP